MSEVSEVPVRVAQNPRLASEWALVLTSEGLASSVQRTNVGYAVCVPVEQADRAARVLAAYEAENPPVRKEREGEAGGPGALNASLAMTGTLLVFFLLVTGPRDPEVRWFERGSAEAEAILSGELWRTVTALTLHADLGHVLANAIVGALFFTAVGRALGPGLGLALVLLAGAGGNLINALLRSAAYSSVGASTSVFGAVGLLGGLGVVRRRRRGTRGHRLWTPYAAGLALLAMLGTGERADIWAHLFGLVVGGTLGILAALAKPRQLRPVAQWTLGVAALVTVLYCWALALA